MWDPLEEYINGTSEEPRRPSAFIIKLTELFKRLSAGGIIFALMGFLVLIPILFDFSQANTFGRIAMIAGTAYTLPVLLLAILITSFPSSFWKNLFYFAPFIVAYIVGIVAYFKHDLWGLKSFFMGLFISYIMLIGIFESIRMLFDKTFENDRSSIILISTAIVTILIAKINETQNNLIASDLFYKIGIGIAYLMGIAIYAHVCLQGKLSTSHPIHRILGIVFWGALITITFPFYVKWCGLNGKDFDTFVSVYSAFLGGALTLAGVAWTIRHTEKSLKKDELLKVKPILYAISQNSDYNIKQQIDVQFVRNEQSKSGCVIGIIKNTDNGIFIVKEAIVNGETYKLSYGSVLEKNAIARVSICYDTQIEVSSMTLVGSDVLGNVIKYKFIFNDTTNDIESLVEEE